MKYLFESLDDQREILLNEVTWDDIMPDPELPEWQQKVLLPYDFMSNEEITSNFGFRRWYNNFIKIWGTQGILVEVRPNVWKLKENAKWDAADEEGSKGVSKYYDSKKSGGYTGD